MYFTQPRRLAAGGQPGSESSCTFFLVGGGGVGKAMHDQGLHSLERDHGGFGLLVEAERSTGSLG